MELKDYLTLIRRRAWLLVLGPLLGAIIGILVSMLQTPVYEATTRIMVMRAPQAKSTDYTYLSDQQLVQTYIQLLTTRSVIEGASARLGFSVDRNQIVIQKIGDTQTIQVAVKDANAQRAADIANTLIQVLIDQNELIQSGRFAATEQNIQEQIKQIEEQITQLRSEIDTISVETVQKQQTQVEAQIAILSSEVTQLQVEIQQLSTPTAFGQSSLLIEKKERLNQIQPILTLYQQLYMDLAVLGKPVSSGDNTTVLSQMQSTLQLYQQIYINLLNNLEEIRLSRLQNTPNIVPIENALAATSPIQPRPVTNTGLGAVLGLLMAGAIAYMIEYLDDKIRTPEDIERILNVPVIGYIGDMSNAQNEIDDIHVINHPRSPAAEAFRSLRTNLEFTNVDSSLSKILVTSPGPGEGKTTVSINLAAIIAQGGKRVLLIDADLRKPRIHSIFGTSNWVGLTTLFRGQIPLKSVMQKVEGSYGFYIVTSGKLPPNPTELLASAKMDQILLEASREVDVIILDSSPSLVTDFQVLAAKVNGVVIVIQPGYTHGEVAHSMQERLNHVNAKTLGVVLNKIPKSNYSMSGYYNHSYPYTNDQGYYQQDEDPNPQREIRSIKLLPPSPSQDDHEGTEVYIGSLKTFQKFYSNKHPQNYDDLPPEEVPGTKNVITQPSTYQDAVPILSPTGAKKQTLSKPKFDAWYVSPDDNQEDNEHSSSR